MTLRFDNTAIVYAPYMYIDGHATENYDDASTLKVYASIRITQILGNLTHAQTDRNLASGGRAWERS